MFQNLQKDLRRGIDKTQEALAIFEVHEFTPAQRARDIPVFPANLTRKTKP